MKVEGPHSLHAPVARRRLSGPGGSDFASALDEAGHSEANAPAGSTAPAAAPNSLFALQMVEGAPDDAARRRAKNRAEEILRLLEQLKLGILLGAIPRSNLIGLAQTVKSLRDQVLDPQLNEVLDEIDLRAQVELAKYDPTTKSP